MNELYIKHLQDMVRIPTISCADESKVDYAAFEQLHKVMEKNYPMIHKKMKKYTIGKAGILFHYEAKETNKLPVLLMGHQDVVPEGEHSKWTHPPYAAEIADGCIWGRGCGDCKHVIMAEMEAVESLFNEGFEPDYDLYLAYADNEEVQAEHKTAKMTVEYLKSKKVRLGCVFDEGSGITIHTENGVKKVICQLELGEKAFNDVEIYVESEGGHAMYPGKGTALGLLSKGAVAVEEHPFLYRLTPLVVEYLKAIAPGMKEEVKRIYESPEQNFNELCMLAQTDPSLDALLHTTCAITMAQGSSQSNILPDRASMIINCRLLEGDTTETLLDHFHRILPEGVKVRILQGENPEKPASVNTRPYQLVKEIAIETYGNDVIMVPGLLAGGTDCRFYAEICDSTFRHAAFIQDERWGLAHKVDEKIPCDVLESGVMFYKKFLLKY